MSRDEIAKVLRTEYDIKTEEELDYEIGRIGGVRLGIFTEPFTKIERKHEKKDCSGVCMYA